METFGEYIRKLREEEGMPLRKLAAALDIDQSTLSKIERNERRPTKDMVIRLAKTFKLDKKQLMIRFLSDRITYELIGEDVGLEALKVAEANVEYMVKERNPVQDKKNIIPKIKNYLKKLPVEKAWLFGSYARGDQDHQSDLDIMVKYTKKQGLSLFDVIEMIHDLEQILNIKVDWVEQGYVKPFAKDSVERERILIYEKRTI